MSKEDRNRNGYPDGNFNNQCELALVEEIMRTIDQYNKDKQADLYPVALRDTMLAVASLLHLEAARIGQDGADTPPTSAKALSNALAKAAREALRNVSLAKAALVSSQREH
jgi:hypothetical protein